jgi:site-specific recombinase XerC
VTLPAAAGAGAAADQILADYAAALERAPLAPASRSKYLSRVRGFLAWLVDADVDGDPLTDPAARDWAVRDYRAHLKALRKSSPATINITLAALGDFYQHCGLGAPAARREDLPARDAPRALGERDARRFLRAVEQEPSVRDRLVALLPYFAGLRDSEVVRLDVDDVRLSARKGELRVLGKGADGGKPRTVPVHAELRAALQDLAQGALEVAGRRRSSRTRARGCWRPGELGRRRSTRPISRLWPSRCG